MKWEDEELQGTRVLMDTEPVRAVAGECPGGVLLPDQTQLEADSALRPTLQRSTQLCLWHHEQPAGLSFLEEMGLPHVPLSFCPSPKGNDHVAPGDN